MTEWIEHSNYKKGLIEKGYEKDPDIPLVTFTTWRWTAPSKKKDGTIVFIQADTLKELRHKVSRYRNGLEPEVTS